MKIVARILDWEPVNQNQTLPNAKQAWFADDGTGDGAIVQLKQMWENVIEMRPKYVYFPKARKSILIVNGNAWKTYQNQDQCLRILEYR